MGIGKKLKEMREAVGLSQKELAYRMGWTTPQFCSNFEQGKSFPSLSALDKLSVIYGVNPEELKVLVYRAKVDEYKKDLKAKLGL